MADVLEVSFGAAWSVGGGAADDRANRLGRHSAGAW